jgi:hypothetical protein
LSLQFRTDRHIKSMKQAFKLLSLLLVFLATQHGAVVHELGHVVGAAGIELNAATGVTDTNCALCPAFAQAATAAFSHTFTVPRLERASVERCDEPQYSAISAAVPQARSRGPPALI